MSFRYIPGTRLEKPAYTFLHLKKNKPQIAALPEDFLINHISGSFVEMVLWRIRGGRKEKPEELDRYFRAVIEPILEP